MSKTVALITVNDHEKEAPLRRAFQKAARRTGCAVIDPSGADACEIAAKLRGVQQVFVAADAVIGANYAFGQVAQLLLRLYQSCGLRPVLIVSDADSPNASLSSALLSLADHWAMRAPDLPDSATDLTVLYYSYRRDSFSFFPDFPASSADPSALEIILEKP